MEISANTAGPRRRSRFLTQANICLAMAALTALVWSIWLPDFPKLDNLSGLLESISYLGILGLGQCIVVLTGQIDLSQSMVMLISSSTTMYATSQNVGLVEALALGAAVAAVLGAINGLLVVSFRVSAFVLTFATSLIFFGAAKTVLLGGESVFELKQDLTALTFLAKGSVLGLPFPIVGFVCLGTLLGAILEFTAWGRLFKLVGSNGRAAFTSGFPVKKIIISAYVGNSLIAFLAGLLLFSTVRILSYDQFASSTSLYDIILLVVLGGVSIAGGRGGMINIFFAAILVAVLLNGFVLMNFSNDIQQIVKACILLTIVIADSRLNPRDEDSLRQGDLF